MANIVEETPRVRLQGVPVSGQSFSMPFSPRTRVQRVFAFPEMGEYWQHHSPERDEYSLQCSYSFPKHLLTCCSD